MIEGTVVKSLSGHYAVKAADGVFLCSVRGIFRLKGTTPLAGDRVSIKITDKKNNKAQIVHIHERRNELKRPRAANIDAVCVIFSSAMPRPDFMLIDKLIATALHDDIDVILCENKADLTPDISDAVKIAEYDMTGLKKTRVSALKNTGIDGLEMLLSGMTTVFAGQSGAGKSSIINRIVDGLAARTGEISAKNKKGKHTTRHAELIGLARGGYIIDTPGFSNLDIGELDYRTLGCCYPEFEGYTGKCRFKGCSHTQEPGCAVKEAVAAGGIPEGRYERYVCLYDMLKEKNEIKYR